MSVETMKFLKISRRIRADRQAVWDAWTRPEHVMKWSCPVPGGVREFEADFRVGGAYALAREVDGMPHTAIGRYREIDAPHRLVYTWDWREGSIGETLVTVEFEERDGETEVTLTHEGFPTAEARDNHRQGWTGCVQNFEALFA